jgi:hypothetical protein
MTGKSAVAFYQLGLLSQTNQEDRYLMNRDAYVKEIPVKIPLTLDGNNSSDMKHKAMMLETVHNCIATGIPE